MDILQRFMGDLSLYHDTQTTIDELSRGSKIKYRIRFPNTTPLPTVTQIIYNGRTYCSESISKSDRF